MLYKRFRKGISAAIAGMIVLAVLVLLVFPFIITMFNNALTLSNAISREARLEHQRKLELIASTYLAANDTLILKNVGPITTSLRYLVLDCDGDTRIVDLYRSYKTNNTIKIYHSSGAKASSVGSPVNGVIQLPPHEWISIVLPDNCRPKALVTVSGKVINLENLGSSGSGGYSEVAGSVKIVPVSFTSSTDIEDLLNNSDIDVTHDPSIPEDEALEELLNNFAERSGGALVKVLEANDTTGTGIYVRMDVALLASASTKSFGNIIVGYYPKSNDKRTFSIMIAANDFDPIDPDVDPEYGYWFGWIEVEGCFLCYTYTYTEYSWSCSPSSYSFLVKNGLGDYTKGGFRIIIEGLRIENDEDLKIYYRGQWYEGNRTLGIYYYCGIEGRGGDCVLHIEGYAKRVLIYKSDENVDKGSIKPYFLFADIDGNGFPEMVFTTEDFVHSYYYDYADYVGYELYRYYIEFSAVDETLPLWIIFKDPSYVVDSTKYAAVQVLIRIYYHDSVALDTDEVNDPKKWLFTIALIDPETGQVVSSYEGIYQMLDDIEDTWPPNRNYVTMNIPLIVPNTGKTYYLAIAFQDPYMYSHDSNGNPVDDVEFTLIIEWVGITYFYRGG